MIMKYEIMKLKEKILQNIDYLSTEYHQTNDILSELIKIIHWDMSNNTMFHWWVAHEDSIITINKLLKELEN